MTQILEEEKYPLILDVKSAQIYDSDKLKIKWDVLPEYVKATRIRIDNPNYNPNYDKTVLDKWGRKDTNTGLYVETPEMVFFRAAYTIAQGLVKNDPSLDYDQTVKSSFEKLSNREVFPNTPYMANSGHMEVAQYYQQKILEKFGIKKDLIDILSDSQKSLEEITKAGLNGKSQMVYDLLSELEHEKEQKNQLFACFVLEIYDSRKSIFKTMDDASEIQKLIGGTGFNFSYLRPANETIGGSGGMTDGPVSFMAGYSHMLGKIMNQGGKREGANMFMLDANHPDVMRFIYSKRQDGEISAANISVAADHQFMQAYLSQTQEGSFYPLKNPHFNPELRPNIPEHYSLKQLKKAMVTASNLNKKTKLSLILDKDETTVLSPFVADMQDDLGNQILGEEDQKIGKVIGETIYLDAKKVMKHIGASAWFNGEPGMIFVGHINDENPTHPRHYVEYLKEKEPSRDLEEILMHVKKRDNQGKYVNLPVGVGEIRATNPCGEKPLLANEACVLGHINLELMLDKDQNDPSGYVINRQKIKENTQFMYEILDNAIDQNHFTNPEIEQTQKSNRKIGLGFMGLANMLMKLEIPYNSEEARQLVRDVWGSMEAISNEASFEKAQRVGAFPNFEYSSLRKGRLKRNAIVRTLAPTGTTAFVAKTTGGCEPEYALVYTRTTVQGTEIKMFNPTLDEKLLKYNIFFDLKDKEDFMNYIGDPAKGSGSLQGWEITQKDGESEISFANRKKNLVKLKDFVVTTYDISPSDHIKMQAVVQEYTDDAISKTTNFRKNSTIKDIEDTYKLAYELETKGTTFYRDGTRKGQPLEVKRKNNEKAKTNTLEDYLRESAIKARVSLNGDITTPADRPLFPLGFTEKFKTPYDSSGFLTVNWDPETGKFYESFLNIGKAGKDIPGLAEAYGRLISLGLQHGVEALEIQEQLEGISGETQFGIGDSKVTSLPDSIAKAIKRIMVKRDTLFGSGILNSPKRNSSRQSGNFCPNCSKPLSVIEGCEKCLDDTCAYSKC